MNNEKELELLMEEALQMDEILYALSPLLPLEEARKNGFLFDLEMEKSEKILQICQACDWHCKELPLEDNTDLIDFIEMSDEEAEGKTVIYYVSTDGILAYIDGEEVEYTPWREVQAINRIWNLLT